MGVFSPCFSSVSEDWRGHYITGAIHLFLSWKVKAAGQCLAEGWSSSETVLANTACRQCWGFFVILNNDIKKILSKKDLIFFFYFLISSTRQYLFLLTCASCQAIDAIKTWSRFGNVYFFSPASNSQEDVPTPLGYLIEQDPGSANSKCKSQNRRLLSYIQN